MATIKLKKIFASSPATERGEPIVLGGDPKGKNFLYTNGNHVFIRDIENPAICDVYAEHQCATTVAKYSPSGFYIASADIRGNLRIWDTVNPEHILSKEFIPISGKIKDIAWSPDSKRIIVVGEGREKFAAAIMADSGTTIGNVHNNSKRVNTCDFKQTRPFRVVTGSDDAKVSIFEGPPFKLLGMPNKYKKYVNSTRYAPSGEFFCAGDSGGMCIIYDGKTGEYKCHLGGGENMAHTGGIYGTAWSGDSKQVLTVSGDKTAKIWDVETSQIVTEFVLGTEVKDMQVSCLWQNNHILTASLCGDFNYLDPNDSSKPCKIIKGHQKTVQDLTFSADKTKIYSGSFDGVTNCFDINDGQAIRTEGSTSLTSFTQMAIRDGKISTIAPDDNLREIDPETMNFVGDATHLDFQPAGVARGAGNLVVVVGIEKIALFRDGRMVSSLGVPFNCTAVDIHPNDSEIAVGGDDEQLHIYTISGDTVQEKKSFTSLKGQMTKCRYSPTGEYLVAVSSEKQIDLWKVFSDYEPMNYTQYNHNAKVTDVAWHPDGHHYATSCIDTSISVWDVSKQRPDCNQQAIHCRGPVNCLRWLDDHTIVSGGSDCCIRISEVTFK